MASEIPNSNIVDAKIKDALTNHPTKKDVDDAMKSKQDALNNSQTNAVNSGITNELVSKLKNIEEGAQRNPDLSLYAKKTEIPVIPDMSKYAQIVDVQTEELRATKAERAINLKIESIDKEIKSLEEVTDNKVEKVSGKGLSTEDYTTTEKNKLAGVEEGAQVNPNVVTPSASSNKGEAADAKATYNALCEANDAAMLAVYYPEGNVTSLDQITTEGLEYTYDDATMTATLSNGLNATGDVVIPWKVIKNGEEYKVTEIGLYAFFDVERYYSANISSVVAPTTITNIGVGAFEGCSELMSVSFPLATSIEESAFARCASLISISLPSATSIGNNAFTMCNSLISISLPSATSIGNSAFLYCASLMNISLPSVTSIMDGAFMNCTSLTSVDFGATPRNTIPTISFMAFYDVPASCKIIIPLGMYDEWIAADGWRNIYADGYNFVGYADVKSIMDMATPKYGSVNTEIAGSILMLTPYSRNALTSDGTAFTVVMGGETGKMRDCVFVVTAGDAAPTITWGAEFHPRTDAATDFACVAGAVNVYWITEYAEGQFAVAGWQVTEGGNA